MNNEREIESESAARGFKGLLAAYRHAWLEGWKVIFMIFALWVVSIFWHDISDVKQHKEFFEIITPIAFFLFAPIVCYVFSRLTFAELPRGEYYKSFMEFGGDK